MPTPTPVPAESSASPEPAAALRNAASDGDTSDIVTSKIVITKIVAESATAFASPTEGKPGRFYRPELDVLRFVAFFGVFIFHAFPHYQSFYAASGFPDWLAKSAISFLVAGAYGVDLFFALSAYLITGLLLRERGDTGQLHVRGFYLRRILRIWPLYLSFVALAALLSMWLPQQRLAWQYIAGYTLLAGNWVYVFHGLPAGITIPLWTVSIEEQFYLTWPLAVRRASVTGMVWIAVGVLVVANAVRVWLALSGASLQAMEYNTFTRLDPIALGILLALFADRKTFDHKGHEGTQKGNRRQGSLGSSVPSVVRRLGLAIAGAATLVGCATFNGWTNPESPETWRLAVTHPLIALGSVAILMAFVGAEHSWSRNPVLIYLGKISYGLYVVHVLGLFLAQRFLHPASLLGVMTQAVAGLAITVVLAAASYRWLETPFLKLKERFAHVQSRPV
jgi:peptidoglycan/LPS O-acetylase OafA/YrhL